MILDIACPSHNASVVLGTVELPDTATPAEQARATAGYLCSDCGAAYAALVEWFEAGIAQVPGIARPAPAVPTTPAGIIPGAPVVTAVLAVLGIPRTNPL